MRPKETSPVHPTGNHSLMTRVIFCGVLDGSGYRSPWRLTGKTPSL